MRTASYVLENGLPEDVLLNVNFPEVEALKGVKLCRIGRGRWMKEMKQVSEPKFDGQRIIQGAYQLTGYFLNLEPEAEDTDYWALDHGYAAITPIQLDMTARSPLPAPPLGECFGATVRWVCDTPPKGEKEGAL